MRAITEQQKQEAIAAFAYEGTLIADTVYGSGHINDTFRLTFAVGNMGDLDVILQRMNADAFPHPEQLMENIAGVTGFLKKKIIARGGDPERETLNTIPTVDNKPYYRDTNGDYWRSYRFITGASSFDQVETPQQFYESAVAFGSFQRLLADYPAETLHETIPGFHDTRARFAAFEKAVREDVVGRAAEVQKEIAFFLERKETACYFAGRLDRGELPIRVTHNDTKLNNVMLDDKTGKGVCVIDLDTVMPGLAMNDFGDAIRYGASTAAEDERDLSEVSCSMELFSLFTKGFLEGCGGSLTPEETALLPMGAKVMTYECGMRFLMDYLQGDRYFKIHRDGQNLDRARTQLTLVADMERKMQQMQDIVRKAAGQWQKRKRRRWSLGTTSYRPEVRFLHFWEKSGCRIMVTARQTGFISTITWNLAIVITGQATWYWGMTPTVFRGSSLPSSRRIFRTRQTAIRATSVAGNICLSMWRWYLTVFSRTMHSAKSAHCSGSMKSRGFWRKQSIRRKRQKLKKS